MAPEPRTLLLLALPPKLPPGQPASRGLSKEPSPAVPERGLLTPPPLPEGPGPGRWGLREPGGSGVPAPWHRPGYLPLCGIVTGLLLGGQALVLLLGIVICRASTGRDRTPDSDQRPGNKAATQRHWDTRGAGHRGGGWAALAVGQWGGALSPSPPRCPLLPFLPSTARHTVQPGPCAQLGPLPTPPHLTGDSDSNCDGGNSPLQDLCPDPGGIVIDP